MPTYHVTTLCGRLRPTDRDRVAGVIAAAHEEATGAGAIFVQVLFEEIAPAAVYVGGAPAVADHLFVEATIRAGRGVEATDHLVGRLVERLSTALEIVPSAIWVYVHELAPRLMVEYGRPLPAPGEEAPWLRDLGMPGD